MGYDRRAFLRDGLWTLAGGALLSRGGVLLDSKTGHRSEPAKRAAAPASRPRRGGTLRVGTINEINSFNPFSGDLNAPGILYARAVFDPLTAVAEDGSVRPYLAESVTPNHDYTVWTVTVRPGISFHDGTPLDATSLKFYFDSMLTTGRLKVTMSILESAAITGPRSVAVTMKEPWVAFPAYLCGEVGTSQIGYVPAPAMIKNPNGGSHPIGTGPFVFTQWIVNDHFIAKKNPHYWRPGLPYLDGIEFIPIVSGSSRAASLLSGSVDLIQAADPETILEVRSSSGYRVITNEHHVVGEPDQNFVMLNTGVAPLDDVDIRRALAYALDVPRIISLTTKGLEVPSTGPFAPGTPYYAPTGYPTYDPKKAKALVAAYKAKKGTPSITLSGSSTAFYEGQNELIQAMWEAAGFKVSLAPAVSDSTGISNTLVGKYQAELWQQFGVPDPDLNYIFWTGTVVTPVGSFSTNFARLKDPVVDAALKTGRTNPDPKARIAAYQSIARQFAVQVPYLWLSRVLWAMAYRDTVHGVTTSNLPDGETADWFNQGDFWFTQTWLS